MKLTLADVFLIMPIIQTIHSLNGKGTNFMGVIKLIKDCASDKNKILIINYGTLKSITI